MADLPPINDAIANPAFVHVLTTIIGLDTQPMRDRVIVRGGVREVHDLLLVDMDSLLDCLKHETSVMAKTRLKTFKLWAEEQHDLHGHIDIKQFTEEICRLKQMKIAKATVKTKSGGSDVTSAGKEKLRNFNGKMEHWLGAKRELTAYLNQILNENGVPIYYVIRDTEDEEEYREHNGDMGNRIYDAPYLGRIYNDDAFKVLQILRLWTSNGTAQTFVDQTNDVQDAWASLLTAYEGLDAKNANITSARAIIGKASWVRDTATYSFTDYCNKHTKNNNVLNRYKANVDGHSQVKAFLNGIKAEKNPAIHAIKVFIGQQQHTKEDLNQAIIAFKDGLKDNPGGYDYKDTRQVGATYRQGQDAAAVEVEMAVVADEMGDMEDVETGDVVT